jgi:hypothetical protein
LWTWHHSKPTFNSNADPAIEMAKGHLRIVETKLQTQPPTKSTLEPLSISRRAPWRRILFSDYCFTGLVHKGNAEFLTAPIFRRLRDFYERRASISQTFLAPRTIHRLSTIDSILPCVTPSFSRNRFYVLTLVSSISILHHPRSITSNNPWQLRTSKPHQLSSSSLKLRTFSRHSSHHEQNVCYLNPLQSHSHGPHSLRRRLLLAEGASSLLLLPEECADPFAEPSSTKCCHQQLQEFRTREHRSSVALSFGSDDMTTIPSSLLH